MYARVLIENSHVNLNLSYRKKKEKRKKSTHGAISKFYLVPDWYILHKLIKNKRNGFAKKKKKKGTKGMRWSFIYLLAGVVKILAMQEVGKQNQIKTTW